jgi:hypothetical protein
LQQFVVAAMAIDDKDFAISADNQRLGEFTDDIVPPNGK